MEDEPAGERVEQLLTDAHENKSSMLMAVVNAGEVWYILAREVSEEEADSSIAEIKQLGIEFVDANWKLAQEVARLKSKHKMSFADCFAADIAKENKAELMTGDPEFRQSKGRSKSTGFEALFSDFTLASLTPVTSLDCKELAIRRGRA